MYQMNPVETTTGLSTEFVVDSDQHFLPGHMLMPQFPNSFRSTYTRNYVRLWLANRHCGNENLQ